MSCALPILSQAKVLGTAFWWLGVTYGMCIKVSGKESGNGHVMQLATALLTWLMVHKLVCMIQLVCGAERLRDFTFGWVIRLAVFRGKLERAKWKQASLSANVTALLDAVGHCYLRNQSVVQQCFVLEGGIVNEASLNTKCD